MIIFNFNHWINGFFMEDNKLFFEIIDNGTGFSQSEKENKNKSLALKITKERLKTIAQKNHFVLLYLIAQYAVDVLFVFVVYY